MALIQNINVSTPNDGLGDTLRDSQIKANDNFAELNAKKVEVSAGFDLSENNYTDAEVAKLAGIETGAEVNVQSNWNQTDNTQDDYIIGKPEQLFASTGYFDLADSATTTTPLVLVAGVEKKLTNDTLGTFTNVATKPFGVSTIWNDTTNQFDFSELSVGDEVTIRVDLTVTCDGLNQVTELFMRNMIGSVDQYDQQINIEGHKITGDYPFVSVGVFHIGSQDFIDYPAELYVVSDDTGEVIVNGFYVSVLQHDVNVVNFVPEGVIQSVQEGTNITVDNTDPLNPIISSIPQDVILPVTETGTSFSLTDAYNGKVVILTASCTVTIPDGLVANFEVTIVTLTGVTLTVALGGSVVLYNNVGLTMAEKLSFTLKNRTATNEYITAGNL